MSRPKEVSPQVVSLVPSDAPRETPVTRVRLSMDLNNSSHFVQNNRCKSLKILVSAVLDSRIHPWGPVFRALHVKPILNDLLFINLDNQFFLDSSEFL